MRRQLLTMLLSLCLPSQAYAYALKTTQEGQPVRWQRAQIELRIDDSLSNALGADATMTIMVEPGRYMVADAGVLRSEVVLVSQRSPFDTQRWVYIDCGKFHGLAETMDEAIRYRLRTPHDGMPTGPVAIAGPTCDSADVLYEKSAYELPLALAEGDFVDILSAGAYTTTYSSVGFNGFAPLADYYL